MSRKILYLGENSWCYTENCKLHGEAISLQSKYLSLVSSGDIQSAEEVASEMITMPTSKEALLRLKVQQLREKLNRKPTIGLDFDGTVADFTHGLREHMGTKYQIPRSEWEKTYPDPDSYEYSEGSNPWFSSRQEFMTEFLQAEKQGLYTKLRLIDSPNATLNKLKGYGFRIIGTTARSDIYNGDTIEWLKKNRISAERVIHTGPRKSHISEVDLFIEDSPKVLDELFENNRPAIVKTQDYNKELKLPENLSRRMDKWDENTTPEEVVNLAFSTNSEKK